MIVTIDNGITTYEFRKNCKIKIRKIYKDGEEKYLFEYGFTNRIAPQLSVWSDFLSPYIFLRVVSLFNYVGFDRNVNESDVISVLNLVKRYILFHKNEDKNEENK